MVFRTTLNEFLIFNFQFFNFQLFIVFKKKKNIKKEENSSEMGFLGHLEELRKRIFYSVLFIALGCVISGIFIDDLMNFALLMPATNASLTLQNLRPFGQLFLYFKIILIVGIIIASPMILYQVWRFIAPGLYTKERQWARWITFYTSICFFSGVLFAYFVIIPGMLSFASNFGTEKIKNIIDINEYFSYISMMLLASGLVFEMPVVTYILAKFGLITAKFMRKYRRHSIIVILIIAAVITPTPDPINQLIFAAPLFILYEISIFIAMVAETKRVKREVAVD
jgi:sec-independent protein translocase protein TatC